MMHYEVTFLDGSKKVVAIQNSTALRMLIELSHICGYKRVDQNNSTRPRQSVLLSR